jgi:hypothetical protein
MALTLKRKVQQVLVLIACNFKLRRVTSNQAWDTHDFRLLNLKRREVNLADLRLLKEIRLCQNHVLK